MKTPISVVQVGSGGFAASHLKKMLDPKMAEHLQLVGVVDPYAASSSQYDNFKNLVPVYDTLADFYAENSADLAFIATPIHLHFEQCITAMDNGSHVLCEKPLVPTLNQLDQLEAKSKSTCKTCAVAFQWCHSSVMLNLKERILAGEFGKPINLKALVSWPRAWSYFSRSWAGRLISDCGKPVRDSILSNATAHYIQNMLFVLGPTMAKSAELTNINAECYRANDIETFDTIALSGQAGGADVFFAASHATNFNTHHPLIDYTFENARILISFCEQDGRCVVHRADGRIEDMGDALGNGFWNELIFASQSVRGERPWCCTIDTVRPFTALVDHVFSNVSIKQFNNSYIVQDLDKQRTFVKNLHLDLIECYNMRKLPQEIGFAWQN